MKTEISSSQLAALAQWLEAHSAQLPQLLSDLDAMFAAGNLSDFWTALKATGDLVLPWLEDFPLDPSPAADGAAKVSINLPAILNALPQLIALIQAIAAAFGQASGNQPVPAAA